MDSQQFQECSIAVIDYIRDYLGNIESHKVIPDVQPGYLRPLIPDKPPEKPECWQEVLKDVDRVILPGMTHWHHPNFFAYFPAANSYAALCGDILSGGFGCIGFTWATSPACTELEIIMMDWVAKMIDLPKEFLSGGKGGGVLQSSASESTLLSMCAARNKTISEYLNENPDTDKYDILSKLVAYTSDQAHCSVEKDSLLTMIRLRKIKSDHKRRMGGSNLEKQIKKDIANGLIPFFCVATLGTTNSCAFDPLTEVGPICQNYNIWLHVDAAYAGSGFICPELRPLLDGVEYAMSYNFSPHKWLLVNYDCSCLWLQNYHYLTDAFDVSARYLKHKTEKEIVDYRHWQIPLGRRFRSLKIWFVLRLYGVEKLQAYIRNHVRLAKLFESLLIEDGRFCIVEEVKMGLVCFRLLGENLLTRELHNLIERDGRLHLTGAEFPEKNSYFIRLSINYEFITEEHIRRTYLTIAELADQLIDLNNNITSLQETAMISALKFEEFQKSSEQNSTIKYL